jgi:hypothetical protein
MSDIATENDDLEPEEVFINILKKHGVSKIVAHFSGGGDDGQIHNIDHDGLISDPHKHPWPVEYPQSQANSHQPNTFFDFLHEVAYYMLEKTGYDWCNNDGGFGEVTIIPGIGHIFVDMNINEMSSENIPLDFSLSGSSSTPPPTTAQGSTSASVASNPVSKSVPLAAAVTKAACEGHLTPQHLDAFRSLETRASLYDFKAEDEQAIYQAVQQLGDQVSYREIMNKARDIRVAERQKGRV